MIDQERRVTMDADMLSSYSEFPDKCGAPGFVGFDFNRSEITHVPSVRAEIEIDDLLVTNDGGSDRGPLGKVGPCLRDVGDLDRLWGSVVVPMGKSRVPRLDAVSPGKAGHDT